VEPLGPAEHEPDVELLSRRPLGGEPHMPLEDFRRSGAVFAPPLSLDKLAGRHAEGLGGRLRAVFPFGELLHDDAGLAVYHLHLPAGPLHDEPRRLEVSV
jgi:hypothetical protein